MNTYNNSVTVKFITDQNGTAGVLTPVKVYLAGTTTEANLFDADDVATTNPVFTDAAGNYKFNIEDGFYDIIVNEDFLSEVRLENQQIATVVPVDAITGHYDTLQDAISAPIIVGQIITTTGYNSVNDGGAGQYIVVAGGTGTDDGGSYLDMSNGNQLELVVSGVVNAIQFGARTDDTQTYFSSDSINNALRFSSEVYLPKGVYNLDKSIEMDSGQKLYGAGCDEWDHLDPNPNLKSWDKGTTLNFIGTGAKTKQLTFATDQKSSGGVVNNPDSVNSNDTEYSLHSFMNDDATGTAPATNKFFSAGIHIKPYSANCEIRDLRIMLNYNGIDGYKDSSLTGLGDNWDVGIYLDNAAFFRMNNVQSVGYWRVAGFLGATTNDQDYLDSFGGILSAGRAYHSHIENCIIQGHTGVMIRGTSNYKSVAITSNTVEIPFEDTHPFPSSGTFRSPKGTFSYASLDLNSSNLRFNGVTPDPSIALLGAGPVRANGGSVGLGGFSISRSLITGLDHSSGVLATSTYLNLKPSKALELHGGFRMLQFDMNYIQTKEDILMHSHNVDDLRFSCGQFESNDYRTSPAGVFAATHGSRILASPQDINNPIPDASGSTKVMFDRVHFSPHCDFWPYVDRSAQSKFSDSGLYNPRAQVVTDLQYPDSDNLDIEGLNDQDIRLRAKTGKSVILRDTNGDSVMRVSSAGSALFENGNAIFSGGDVKISSGKQLTFGGGGAFINRDTGQSQYFRQGIDIDLEINSNGDLLPRDNVGGQSLGLSLKMFSTSYIKKMYFGTAFTTSGSGSPEGILSASVGSIYTDTSGGAGTTLYIKESGTGNIGWISK